jgi:hypothetical protein
MARSRSGSNVPGAHFQGRVSYTTDYEIGPPGYYGHDAEGNIDPTTRLTWVDHNPNDPTDEEGHFQVAAPGDPSHMPPQNVRADATVELQVEVEGNSDVAS